MERNVNSFFESSCWIQKTMIVKNYSHLNYLPIFASNLLFLLFKITPNLPNMRFSTFAVIFDSVILSLQMESALLS